MFSTAFRLGFERITRNKIVSRRQFSAMKVPPETRRNNLIGAFLICSFVAGVYYTAMNKMKQDELEVLLLEELKSQPSEKGTK